MCRVERQPGVGSVGDLTPSSACNKHRAGRQRPDEMGNTHDTEIARIEADYIHTRWRTNEDYRWGYTNERGT